MNVSLVNSQEALGEACNEVKKKTRVGLDVETTLDKFELRVIQLAIDDSVYVIDALAITDPEPIVSILGDKDITKIIHNASFEVKVFEKLGIKIKNIFDTLAISRKLRKTNKHKLSDVCRRELCITIDKTLQVSDWSQRPLTARQVEYAAKDAHVLLALHDIFREALRKNNLPPAYYDAENDLGLNGGSILDVTNERSENPDYPIP